MYVGFKFHQSNMFLTFFNVMGGKTTPTLQIVFFLLRVTHSQIITSLFLKNMNKNIKGSSNCKLNFDSFLINIVFWSVHVSGRQMRIRPLCCLPNTQSSSIPYCSFLCENDRPKYKSRIQGTQRAVNGRTSVAALLGSKMDSLDFVLE